MTFFRHDDPLDVFARTIKGVVDCDIVQAGVDLAQLGLAYDTIGHVDCGTRR